MQTSEIRSPALTPIRTDLGAIFVSLELSRSKWLITSLSPGTGEKMSKHQAILLEQNDAWAVQRGRYITLETIAQVSDDPLVSMLAVAN